MCLRKGLKSFIALLPVSAGGRLFASVFPNLYFDISLLDNLGPSGVQRVFNEAKNWRHTPRYYLRLMRARIRNVRLAAAI